MSEPHVIRQFAGIVGSANPYVVAPEGALELADECVIRAQQVLSSRRGHLALQYALTVNGIGWKDGYMVLLGWDNPERGIAGSLAAVQGANGPPLATPAQTAALPMVPGAFPFDSPGSADVFGRFVSANKALYFQSRYGLTKIESIPAGANVTGASRAAIQPSPWTGASIIAGIFPVSALPTALTNNWLTTGNQVAYRYTICRIGANQELIESEPSDRIIAKNTTGSSRAIELAITTPYMVPPDAFFRLYRTKQITIGTDPGDEDFLIAEITPNSGSGVLANGYLAQATTIYDDQTGDGSLFVPLYTNPLSGGGLQSSATPAPIAADMAFFKNRLLLLNTRDIERLTIKIIGTGTGGIVDGDFIVVAGVKFAFRTIPGLLTDVKVSTAGTVSQNIEDTARTLAATINFNSSVLQSTPQAIVFARYISSGAADAGQILLQRLLPGVDPFAIQTSGVNGWDSDYTLPSPSSPNLQVAGLSWSLFDEPEAVPLANSAIVGDASSAGQRIIPLKEACLIFKEKDGLFRWTDDGSGNNNGTDITVADPSVRLLAPETAQALDNFVLALCDQGVLLFSEQGQNVDVSFDRVGQEIRDLVAYVGLSTLAKVAFAVAYQAEHEYILCLPESPNATSCTLQYVFNLQTKAWTRWRLPGVTTGSVSPYTGQLVWVFDPTSKAPSAAGNIWIERKAGDATDYQDPGFLIAPPAGVTGTTTAQMSFTGDLTSGLNAIASGDIIQQRQTSFFLSRRVRTVSLLSGGGTTVVTLEAAPSHAWDGTQFLVLKAIQGAPKFLPFTAGYPALVKKWGDVFFAFRRLDLDWLTFGWSSETDTTAQAQEPIAGTSTSDPAPRVALDAFGSQPFGQLFDRRTRDLILRTTLPREVASCAQLTLQLNLAGALCRWELDAIDVKVEGQTPEPVR